MQLQIIILSEVNQKDKDKYYMSILKSRDITLLKKVCIVKTMVSPVVMYGCGSWTTTEVVDWRLKTVAEDWRIDVVVGKTLRVPWTVRRLSKSILKKIISEYSLEGLMLKLQYFGHLIWRVNSWEKTLMLGKIEGRRRRGQQRMRWLYASST